MIRQAHFLGSITVFCWFFSGAVQAQTDPKDIVVKILQLEETKAASKEKNTAVFGSLGGGNHGHLVAKVPGSDRVWDGNTLGGLKDLTAGKGIPNDSVVNRVGLFVKTEFPSQELADVYKADRSERPAKLREYLDKASDEQKQQILQRYEEKGAPPSHSWQSKELEKVQWYQVPTDQKIQDVIKNYQPPEAKNAAEQNLRCNDLAQKVAPSLRVVVSDEVKPPQGQTAADVTANNIDKALQSRVEKQRQAEPPPPVSRPPEPTRTPVFEPTPRERKVETKPGGVIITAVAEISGLKPDQVTGAAFDPAAGILTISQRSGPPITYKVDPDDFTIAVRSVFDRKVDPSLSMSTGDKPGFKAVDYCGPLFKTRFGKVLFEADVLLGSIIFNRVGSHRAGAASILRNYEDLVCEAHRTMTFGSRVFLRGFGAKFTVKEGRLICQGIQTKVDVEGMRFAADYFQESLHRLARAMDENFDDLTENFEEFQDFRRLVEAVALAKWLQRHAIPFEWAALKSRQVADNDIPAYVPGQEWSSFFNGRNLDGWRLNLASGEMNWSLEGGALTVEPTTAKALEMLADNYWKNYDLRFSVVTEGPVEFILRQGLESPDHGAAVTIDTKGQSAKVELFLADGAWTALAPGFGRQGKLNLPETKKGEVRQPNIVGLRVPSGSKLTLYAAALRGR